jgi:hypothetical protein
MVFAVTFCGIEDAFIYTEPMEGICCGFSHDT